MRKAKPGVRAELVLWPRCAGRAGLSRCVFPWGSVKGWASPHRVFVYKDKAFPYSEALSLCPQGQDLLGASCACRDRAEQGTHGGLHCAGPFPVTSGAGGQGAGKRSPGGRPLANPQLQESGIQTPPSLHQTGVR